MPFVEGGIVVDAEPQQQAAPTATQGGFVQGGIEVDPTPEDSYNKVLQYQAAQTDYTPTKQEYLDYLKVSKEKPLLGERPLETVLTAAGQTAVDIAKMPYRLGEAIGQYIEPPEGVMPMDVAAGTAAEIAMQSRLKAEAMARGGYDVALSNLEKLTGKLRSDDDRYQAFLATSEIKRQLARANAPEDQRVPAAQEFLQAYNIPPEAISQPGLEVGGFLADPSSIAFAGGGKAASALLQRAAPLIPRAGAALQRGGERITAIGQAPEAGAGALTTAVTGSPAMGQAVQEAISKGTTGVALGEAAGLPITATMNVPGLGTVSRVIGGTKAAGATMETLGEAGAISGGQTLTPIQRGLLGAGERIAAAEGASAGARAFGTALARSGIEAPAIGAAKILIPTVGAGVGGGLLAGLTGEEGDAIAAAIGSGFAFGAIDSGFRLAKAASSDALNANRVRRTAIDDLNTRPTEVQFTYIDPTTGSEQLSTIKDAESRAKLYASLDNKQLTKALSEVAGAEAGGAEVIFHGNADAVPASLQGINYAGVAIGPNNIKSGKPTILINVDRAKPETLPHEILHAKITSDVLSQLGSQVIESSVQSPEFQKQFTDFANRYADKLDASGAKVTADRIRTELRDAFDPTQQRAQRIENLKRMTDEFAAYYTQEFLKGKDPKTLLPGRIPSFFELAFNNAKEAVAERFTRQALQNGFDPVARTFYDANGKRIKIPWMEDAIKNLISPKEGFEPTEQKVDTRKMTQAQQNALIMARGYSDLFMTAPDGSIVRPLTKAELAAKTADVANRTMRVIETVPQNERTSVSRLDAKGNPVIDGRLSLAEADALSKSGIFSPSTSRYIVDIATAIRDGTLMEGRYWKVYGPTGKSGVFGESEKLFLPYGISINSKGGVNVKAVDWGKVQARMYKALTKPAYKNLFRTYDQAMSTLKDVYLKNIAEQNAVPSAEALGGGIEGAKKRNFFNEVMGAVPKKGDVMINLPTAGYEAGRKGGSVYQDLRIERIQNANLTGNKIPWSGDMGEQSSYRRTQLNFQPAETIGETQVSTDQNGGYRILSKNGKFRLYGPDGSTVGIFDTEGQAKLKAEKDYATQARLQPEVDQQQRPARDEGRQAAEAGRGDRALGRPQGREKGRQELGPVRQAGDVRFMPMSDLEKSDIDLRISTRNPSAKKATENPLTQQLSIDLESIMKTPGALPEIINTVGKYPGIRFERSGSVNRANDFIRFVANNLIYLHDSVIPEIRDRSKLWYDGARKLAEDWSTRFNTTREGVAGVIASLSPQKDWYQNVTLAERVFQVVKDRQNEAFTGPLEQWARTKMTSGQSPKRLVQDEVINGMAGKTFSQLSDYEKAVFVRAFDEVNNTRTYPIVSPEGQMLDIARKADGTPATYAWGDFNSIAKAVKIAENPNKKTISESLGFEHKVRSFYDNILLPNNPEHGDVTIDTHAVAAALMLPLAGSDVYVAHNFGQGVPGSSVYGTSGTYGIYADAYRLAAKERGILPREMQSITWEAIRGLFTPEFKTASNKKLVENLWKEYKSGKATLDETRQRIVDTAGGIRNPSWYGSGGGAVAENAPAAQSQKLPSAGDLGGQRADTGRGGSVPRSGAQEVGAQRFMPSDTDYLSAVQKGDTQAAQRMVDEAARAAGYTVGPVYHGTRSQFTEFDTSEGSHFGTFEQAKNRLDQTRSRGGDGYIKPYYLSGNFLRMKDVGDWEKPEKIVSQLVRIGLVDSSFGDRVRRMSRNNPNDAQFAVFDAIRSEGYDGVVYSNRVEGKGDSYMVLDPKQAKIADPITRDDAGNVIPLSKRFQQTSEDIRYMPSDDEYLTALKRGNTSAAQDMVDAAAKAAGYTVGPVYHGTPTGGFNVFDKRMRGETSGVSRQAFSFTTNQKAAENYSKRLGDEAVRLDAGLRVANDAMRRFDDDMAAQEYFSSKGYTSVEDGMLPEFDWGAIEDVPEFIKELRGYAKDLKPINPDLASSFIDAAKVMSSTKAVPEVKRVFLRIPENAPVFQATPSTLGMVMRDFSAEREPTKAGIVELPGNERIYYVADSSQVKLADPVTKDAQGNVIPLSKRFQASSEDIRFMPDYSGEHRAPGRDSGAPLDNLRDVYPDDVYGPNAARYYGHESGSQTDKAAVRIIQAIKGKPDAPVKVFRAIPKSIQSNEINPGDWITTIKSYAVQHGEGPLGGDYKILEKTVPAGDLYTDGNSIFEFGYDPKFMPQPDSAMPGAYSFHGGYRALPGKAKGSLRLYGPAGSLIGIAASLDEAQRIIRRKTRQ